MFISKSIGTLIAASYAKKYGLIGVRQVLYTPLAETFQFAPEKGFLLSGRLKRKLNAAVNCHVCHRQMWQFALYG
ncbi:MAG: hypothetical protein ACLR2E_06970 [Lachnospiraceae bacterium]